MTYNRHTQSLCRASHTVCWTPSTSTFKIHCTLIAHAQLVSRLHTLGTHSPVNMTRARSFSDSIEFHRWIAKRHQINSRSAYPLASLGYANWILRHYGYKTVFIFGLTLYGIGALCMWPAGLNQSFGGFCGATFVIGSGLGSLETAANPYLTGTFPLHSRTKQPLLLLL